MPSARAAASAAQASGPGVARWTSSGRRALGSGAPAGRRAPGRSAARGTSESRSRRCAARRSASSARLAGLARPDQLDVVAAPAQEADGPLDGERDAVQLGRIGFGDVGDPHRAGGSVHRADSGNRYAESGVGRRPRDASILTGRVTPPRHRTGAHGSASRLRGRRRPGAGARVRLQTARSASSSGTARKAPAMPQSQPQTMTDRKTNTGRRRRRWPMIIGLRKFASMPCSSRNAAGGPSIADAGAEGDAAGEQEQQRDQQRPEVGDEGEHRRRRSPEHRVGQADRPERQPGGDAEGDVDQAHRADEAGRCRAAPGARRRGSGRACAAGATTATVRIDEPALGGEQEVEQDHRRRGRERERDRLADRQAGEGPALARQPLAERVDRRRAPARASATPAARRERARRASPAAPRRARGR